MKQDVILPKLNLPGQSTWLMKGLWIAGGVVVIQVAVVGTLLLRDRPSQPAVKEPAPAATAQAAEVVPSVPSAPPSAPAAESLPEPPREPPAAQRARTGKDARPAPGSQPRMKRAFGGSKAQAGRFRPNGRRNGDRVFARTSLGGRKAVGPRPGRKGALRNDGRNAARAGRNNSKPDEVDQLLRNFK